MVKVQVTDQHKLEKFFRIFKRAVQQEGNIRREAKIRQNYEKPSEKRKRKREESEDRRKRKRRRKNNK